MSIMVSLTYQQYIKDSNGDIVTVVCRVQGFWTDNTKVYDEYFEWNPPYDKRLKSEPKTTEQRKGFSEEQMKVETEIDNTFDEWEKLIRQSSDYDEHYTQAQVKIQEEVTPLKVL